jgi:flagellin-specific chaperone FliS
MSKELSQDTIGELFMNIMQHMKCIEVRLDYAKAATTQKQKYAINGAVNKVKTAINHLCDLLPNSQAVMEVKKNLDKVDLVYVMVLTEQLFRMKAEDMEEVTELIDDYLKKKYGDPADDNIKV